MKNFNVFEVKWEERFAHQKATLFDENDLDSKGSKVQLIKIKPGSAIEPHYHKIRTEVFFVVKGQGVITLGNEELESKEGDFLLCQPNTVHAFKNTGNEDLIITVFRTNDPGNTDMHWL